VFVSSAKATRSILPFFVRRPSVTTPVMMMPISARLMTFFLFFFSTVSLPELNI
jgi:hypothetical protein